MANTIKLKRGTSTPSTSDISSGEVAIDTSAQKLYINDSGTVKEIGGGTTVGGATGVDFNDDVKVRFGTGNDLQIFADGSNSEIQHNGDGHLLIKSGFGTTAIKCVESGATELYYNGSKKGETVSGGFTVTGTCTATAFSGDGSALTGISAGPGTGQQYVNLETGNSASNTGVNTFAGYLAGNAFTSADHTTLFGYQAGSKITGAGNNCFFGSNAGKETTGVDNCGFGQAALETNTSGASNVAVGRQALYANESGSSNVAIGKEAGKLVTGSEGVFIGASCGTELTSGSANTFVGSFSGQAVCGSHNVAVGSDAFRYGTGGTNTCVGRQAGYISNFSGSNNLLLGYQADPTSASTSNEITLGNTSITKFRIPGLNFSLKDTTATEDYVLTVDANGDCGWEAASASDSTKLPLAGGTLTGNTKLNDNVELQLGGGSDFQAKHDGTDTSLYNYTGDLYLGTVSSGDDVHIVSIDDIYLKCQGSEDGIKIIGNGGVELYYDGAKKFETTSQGCDIGFSNGNVRFMAANGSSNIYIDVGNSKLKFWDNSKIEMGAGSDLSLYHDGSNSWIKNLTGVLVAATADFQVASVAGDEQMIRAYDDGAVELYYDNVKRFDTTSAGISIVGTIEASGNLDLPDWGQLKLGTGDDLLIYHTGSHSYIKDTGTGSLNVCASALYVTNAADSENMVAATENGAVNLYYDNSKKFETNTNGVKVTGQCEISSHAAWPDFTSGYVGKAVFGSNDDLQIYHNGSTDKSIIYHSHASGVLSIAADHLNLADYGNEHPFITCDRDGAVELYYDNSKKFETTAQGIIVGGDVDNSTSTQGVALQTGGKIRSRVADTSATAFVVSIEDSGASKAIINGAGNGYFAGGLDVPDSAKIQAGNGDDLQIWHDGSHSIIDNNTGTLYLQSDQLNINNSASNEGLAKFYANGAVELNYDNSKKLETTSSGVKITTDLVTTGNCSPSADGGGNLGSADYSWYNLFVNNDIHVADNGVIQLGDGNDLKILHDSGGDSYIQDKGSGNLYITGDDIIIQNNDTSENIAKFIENSYVSFYFDNSQKFYTQSYGCVCAGDFKPESNNTYNLGDSSYRWANLYVNDMHFSNEGKSNSVDGTWGDWTLQEGDENIFMINNRTGKKYKMGLQEVS